LKKTTFLDVHSDSRRLHPVNTGAIQSSLAGRVQPGEMFIAADLGVRLSKVLADGDSGASDWRKPELVVESAA
jgi:hypothetical protein